MNPLVDYHLYPHILLYLDFLFNLPCVKEKFRWDLRLLNRTWLDFSQNVKNSTAETQPAYRWPARFWAGLLLLVTIAVSASVVMISKFPLSADEGLYITWARLLAAGYQPYTEVYLTNPPLSPLLLESLWHIGASPTAIKLILLGLWGVGLIAIALLATEMSGEWRAGLAAAFLLGFSAQYFAESQVILMHIVSILPGIVALWLAMWYQRTGNRYALIGSALCTAISLEIKLLSPFLPLLVFGVVLSRHVSLLKIWLALRQPELRREIARVVLIWGAALMALPLLSLIIWDADSMLYGAVFQRLSARDVYPPGEGEHTFSRLGKRLVVYVSNHRALIALGLLGLGVGLYDKRRGRWLALAWLAGAAAMLSFHNPLYHKHFVLLSAPLALSASFLFSLALWSKRVAGRVMVGVVLLGLLGFGAEFAGQMPEWQALAQETDPPAVQMPAIEFIQEVTSPTDCLITDYSQMLLWTSRLPPPELSEVSSSRLRSGFLTTPELIDITEKYDCPIFAPLTGRFRRTTLDFIKWAEGRYRGIFVYTEDKQLLHFGKPIAEAKVADRAVPLVVHFGPSERLQEIELLGYEPMPDAIRAGESIPIKLFWRPLRSPATDYTIFIQLRNGANVTVASADHQPYKGLLPFSRWAVGEVMPETTWLHLPADLPPGNFTLFVGLYDQSTLERLPVQQDVSGEHAVQLKVITVSPKF